ncbi:MAG: hypothetical protein RLZZ502_1040 [Pseudomonadota bacterium]
MTGLGQGSNVQSQSFFRAEANRLHLGRGRHCAILSSMSMLCRFAAYLLLLTLPVQGIAAALMLNCASAHSAMVSAQTVMHTATQLESDASEADLAMQMQSPCPGHELTKKQGNTSDQGGKSGKCSACALCCYGTAVLHHDAVFGALALPAVFDSHYRYSAHIFIPHTLERPPRQDLI